jgi:NAD(P)H dehydrogenase (quinone)
LSIAITGASGNLGGLVVESLLDRHDISPQELILITRTPDKLSQFAERGADVRAGDFDDPASLRSAFAGSQKALIISTDRIGHRVDGHKAAIDAAVAAGARSVVYTSVINPSDSNPIDVMWEHRATEDHLRATAPGWTVLRNSVYSEVLVNSARAAIASGRHVANDGDGRTSYVARNDCAAAAAAVLAGDGHDGKTYDITGPAAISADEAAALFSELSGTDIQVAHVDDASYAAALVEHAGLPQAAAESYTSFGIGARHGYSAPVSDTARHLTGREPIPVRDTLAAALGTGAAAR